MTNEYDYLAADEYLAVDEYTFDDNQDFDLGYIPLGNGCRQAYAPASQ